MMMIDDDDCGCNEPGLRTHTLAYSGMKRKSRLDPDINPGNPGQT